MRNPSGLAIGLVLLTGACSMNCKAGAGVRIGGHEVGMHMESARGNPQLLLNVIHWLSKGL